MVVVIDTKEGVEFGSARRITELIGKHGKEMTAPALDHALNVWASLLKSGLDERPIAPGIGEACRINNLNKEDGKMDQRRKALVEQGRTFVTHGVDPRQAAKMVLQLEKVGQRLDAAMSKLKALGQPPAVSPPAAKPAAQPPKPAAQPAKKHIPWGSTPRLWGHEAIMVDDAPLPGPKAPLPPAQHQLGKGNASLGHDRSRQKNLTGHQLVALKCGVDLDRTSAADLALMDMDRMKALARQQQLEKLTEQRERELASRQPVQIRQWGQPNGFWRR